MKKFIFNKSYSFKFIKNIEPKIFLNLENPTKKIWIINIENEIYKLLKINK